MTVQTAPLTPAQRARNAVRRWLYRPCSPNAYHIPELNGLRVLLVFIVSWYHFWQQSWLTPHVGSYSLDFLVRAGYVPVDGTILLSGFLLFLPHARAMLLGGKTPDVRAFYQKRVMRIVPSYYFVTLLMLFVVALPGLWSNANTGYADKLNWLPAEQLTQVLGEPLNWAAICEDPAALQETYLAAWPVWKGVTTNGPAMALDERMQWIADTYQGDVLRYVQDWMANLPAVYHGNTAAMWEDVVRHLTFTQTFDYATYISTPIGVASWTIAIEMQAYLIFPLLAWCARKKPLATFGFMIAAALGFRCWCLWAMKDYNMVVNQVINFMDVYAIGMASALLYVKLTTLWPKDRSLQLALSAAATLVIILALWGLVVTLQAQAGTPQSGLQAGQMVRRPVFALLLAALTLCLPFALRPVRFLFGNRLMGFLAMVSMNYYLLHQNLAVFLKTRLQLPAAQNYPWPNTIAYGPEQPWANQYMALCFGGSLLLAILVTFLVEKPGAWLLGKGFARLNRAIDARRAKAPEDRTAREE